MALLAGLLTVAPAQAHSTNWKWDANDTGGPFDLHWTKYTDGHGQDNWSGKRRVWLCVQTWSPWQTWQLGGKADGKGFGFALDARGDRAPDYFVGFNQNKSGSLVGRLFNDSFDYKATTKGYRFGEKKGGCVYFKENLIKPIRQSVRYIVFSDYQSRRVCFRGCSDRTAWYSHRY